eukprot:TRINITY_DN24460_c0_g1_i1.p1 TRINITY_DN24460_c0_g1~~TRINITY_DN24460_c0_g1_i1.p1  ORF type:complete len:113 (-),score=21.70 TRINITY_DN24460_c0_g1_i1:70-408(-)
MDPPKVEDVYCARKCSRTGSQIIRTAVSNVRNLLRLRSTKLLMEFMDVKPWLTPKEIQTPAQTHCPVDLKEDGSVMLGICLKRRDPDGAQGNNSTQQQNASCLLQCGGQFAL